MIAPTDNLSTPDRHKPVRCDNPEPAGPAAHPHIESITMNTEQVASLLRTILQVAGGMAVSKGWIDSDTAIALTGALVTIVVTIWGLYARRSAGLVASAAALPGVAHIQAVPKIADAVPSSKVTAVP